MPTAPANSMLDDEEQGNRSLTKLPPPVAPIADPEPESTPPPATRWATDPVLRQQQVRDEISKRRLARVQAERPFATTDEQQQVAQTVNPRTAQSFAGQVEDEVQYQQQVARQNEIEQRRSQLDRQKATNSTREATMRGTGQQFYTDPYGNLQPVIESGTNRPLYHVTPWEPAEHPQTKQPVLTMRDRYGQRQFKTPPIVAGTDLTDDQLYYRMGENDLRPAGKIDDLKRSDNPQIARLAKQTDAKRRSAMWKEAIGPMEAVAAEATANHDMAQQRVLDLGERIDGLTRQSEATTNPDAKAKLDQQLQSLMTEQMGLQDDLKPTGRLGRIKRNATLDLAIFKAKAQHDAYSDLAEERRDILKAQGKPEAGDPTLTAILQAQQTYGKAIDRAATVAERDALAQARANNQPPPATAPAKVEPDNSSIGQFMRGLKVFGQKFPAAFKGNLGEGVEGAPGVAKTLREQSEPTLNLGHLPMPDAAIPLGNTGLTNQDVIGAINGAADFISGLSSKSNAGLAAVMGPLNAAKGLAGPVGALARKAMAAIELKFGADMTKSAAETAGKLSVTAGRPETAPGETAADITQAALNAGMAGGLIKGAAGNLAPAESATMRAPRPPEPPPEAAPAEAPNVAPPPAGAPAVDRNVTALPSEHAAALDRVQALAEKAAQGTPEEQAAANAELERMVAEGATPPEEAPLSIPAETPPPPVAPPAGEAIPAPLEVEFADEKPAASEAAPAPVNIGPRDETVSTGTGVPTAKEQAMLAEQQRLIDEAAPIRPRREDFNTAAEYRQAVANYVRGRRAQPTTEETTNATRTGQQPENNQLQYPRTAPRSAVPENGPQVREGEGEQAGGGNRPVESAGQSPRGGGESVVRAEGAGAEPAGVAREPNAQGEGAGAVSEAVKARQTGEQRALEEGRWQRLMKAPADKVGEIASEYSPEEAQKALDRLNAAPGDNPTARAALESRVAPAAKPTPPDAAPISADTPPPTPESVQGEPVGKGWTAFSPESGSLGIPRAEMPQIKSESRGALVNFLKARDITAKSTMVMPDQLRPTQAEFSPEKVQAARDHTGSERPILISSDGHVVDGHHQWLAALDDTNTPMPVIRLNAPIDKVLAEMKEFPSTESAKGATPAATKTEGVKSASSKISDYTQDEWETLAEELVDASDLAGGSGGRAGRLSYELQDVVQSFADAARKTPDLTIEQAFNNFKDSTDASESRVRQLRSILADHNLLGASKVPVATPKLGDRAIAALQKAKIGKSGMVRSGDPFTVAYDAAIDLAILGIRAGRAAADVVKLAIDRFRAKHPNHTPEELQRLEQTVRAAVTTAEAVRAKKIAAPGEAQSRVPESSRGVGVPAEDITYEVRNQNARMAEARAMISRDGEAAAERAVADRSLPADTRVALGGVLLERKMNQLATAAPADVPRLTRDIQRLTEATRSGVSTESGQGVSMHNKIYQNLAVGSAMEYTKKVMADRLEKMGGKEMADAAQDAADAFNKTDTKAERDAAIEKLKERYTSAPVRRALDQLKRVETAKELNRLGVLTRDDLVEVAGNALGIPGIEQSKLKHIAELADAVTKATTHAERSRAELELADTLSIYKGVNPLDLEASILTLNILSGPTTQAANIEGNALNLLAQLGTTAAVNPTKIAPIWRGLKEGIPLGWTQAKSIMATGRGTRDFQDRTLGAGNALANVDYARDFPKLNQKVGDALTMRARAVEKIGRFMKGADAVFYYPAREAYARLVATKLLEGQYSGKELAQKVSETLHTTPEAFTAARRQAMQEGYTGIDAGRRVADIIEEQRAKTVEGKEAVKQSERFAAEATYNNEPVGLAGVIYRGLARVVKDVRVFDIPILKPWAMFLRVPANVFNATTNFTPIGGLRARFGMAGEKYGYGRTGEGQWRNFSKDERNRLYLQSVIGTTLMAGLTSRILSNNDIGVTAAGPNDPNQRRQLQNAGWNPYSIKVGNKWVSYKDSPLLVPLAIVGHVADAVKYQKAKSDMVLGNRIIDAISHSPQVIFQTSMLSGLADLMSSMSSRDASLQSVARTLGSIPANLAIPYNRLLQQVDQSFDTTSYKSNPVLSSVPFARREGTPRTDVQGRTQTYAPTSRFATSEKGDPVDSILREKNIFIPEAGKDTKLGNRVMTEDEHERYRRLSGQRIRVRLQSIIPRLRLMTQEKAQDEVKRIADEERRRVKPMVAAGMKW